VYYSGKTINDLGNYSGCLALEKAHYIMFDLRFFSKDLASLFTGFCLPDTCTKEMIEGFLALLFTSDKIEEIQAGI
jgi:hypothetical protein